VPVLAPGALQLSPGRDPLAPHAAAPDASTVDLAGLAGRGLLRGLPPELLASPPRIAAASPTERAALGYLHGNCAHCHHDGEARVPVRLNLAQRVGDAASTDRAHRSRTTPRSPRHEPAPRHPRHRRRRRLRGRGRRRGRRRDARRRDAVARRRSGRPCREGRESRAIRHRLGRGRPVLPPMPIPVYGRRVDADLEAIYADLRTIPPVKNRVPEPWAPAGTAAAATPK
jgi:hypothetical protein